MPRPAMVLGFAGLLPFLAGAAGAWAAGSPAYIIVINMQMAYGAVILSFLGAVHWGLAMAQEDAARWRHLGFSVAPALAGWLALILPNPLGLVLLVLGFVAVFFADLRSPRLPPWYKALRKPLTLVTILCLAASYAALVARL
ncbi:MAG: DUF3429 domain-containing protein [Kiloniellaceae bacterium]